MPSFAMVGAGAVGSVLTARLALDPANEVTVAVRSPLTVPAEGQGREFAALWADSGVSVTATDDFVTASWHKLCRNVVGAVAAVTGDPHVDVEEPAMADFVHGVVEEAVTVGRAQGARLSISTVEEIIDDVRHAPPHVTSILADRLAGRPTEVDARNGAVIRFGRRHGIPTPSNDALVALLRATRPRPSD